MEIYVGSCQLVFTVVPADVIPVFAILKVETLALLKVAEGTPTFILHNCMNFSTRQPRPNLAFNLQPLLTLTKTITRLLEDQVIWLIGKFYRI